MSEPKDAARSDAALIAPNAHAARSTDNLNVVLNNQISGAAAPTTATATARPTRVVVPPSASVGASTMDGPSAATESLVGISSLATERMRDGLCPTCGTRLYRLKKESKMTKMGNKLDRMSINPYKKKNRDGGTEGVPDRTAGGRDPRVDPQTKLMRIPLTIAGEVLRGQCLRCTGGERYANGNVYTGEYRAGKRTGQGLCYFANGDLYTGAWNNDLIEGFGRYHYNTGRAFEGNFKAGKREGRGKFQLLNGMVDIYRYVDDKRVGDGVRWSKDRTKAWRLDYKGKKRNKVTLEEAMRIADRCGPVVDYTLQPGGGAAATASPMNPNNNGGTGGTMM